jgi:hypothetical protein
VKTQNSPASVNLDEFVIGYRLSNLLMPQISNVTIVIVLEAKKTKLSSQPVYSDIIWPVYHSIFVFVLFAVRLTGWNICV